MVTACSAPSAAPLAVQAWPTSSRSITVAWQVPYFCVNNNNIIIISYTCHHHILSTLALKTLGPLKCTGISFLSELAGRLTDVSGDSRETTHLSGGPALQFGSLQRNLYSSYRIGLAPLQRIWF